MLYEVSLALMRSREFPDGNPQCRYEMRVPLTADFRLDGKIRSHERNGASIRRLWCGREEQRGRLNHAQSGWSIIFGYGVRAEDAIIGSGRERFLIGEEIAIVEPDGPTRIYSVVQVERDPPVETEKSLIDCSDGAWRPPACDWRQPL